MTSDGISIAEPPGGWTPKAVADHMLEAVRWARFTAGPVGPSSIRSAMPGYSPTWEDRLEEGWGLPEVAGDDKPAERVLHLNLPPEKVSAHIYALQWQSIFLFPEHPTSSRVLSLWIRCRVDRRSFDEAVDRSRYLSRATAYRTKDRALGLIAQGLQSRGATSE